MDEQFLRTLENLPEDGRFEAWMEIYRSSEQARSDFELIRRGEDPHLKVYLLRFLGGVPEAEAVHWIVAFLEDDNPTIFEAAKRAIERNSFDKKWLYLHPLLHSSRPTVQFYAIKKTAAAASPFALPIFLKMLPEVKEDLLLELLKGLRSYSDTRILPHLLFLRSDSREAVRFRLTILLGDLFISGIREVRPYFLSSLDDPAPEVRRAALWSLRQEPNRHLLKKFFAMAKEDPDPVVRQEALHLLSFFPDKTTLYFLIDRLTEEKNRMVILKAESILFGIEGDRLAKFLWEIIKKNDKKRIQKSLHLLAAINLMPDRLVKYLLNAIGKEQHPKQILFLLELLGNTEAPQTVTAICSYIAKDQALAYTAVGALLKIWGRHPKEVDLKPYLIDANLAPILKQSILKQMLKKAKWEFYAQTMEVALFILLKDENLNVRYLAAQILAPTPSFQFACHAMENALTEADPAYAAFLKTAIQKHLTFQPAWIGDLIGRYKENEEQVILIKESLRVMIVEKNFNLEAFFRRMEGFKNFEMILKMTAEILNESPDFLAQLPTELVRQWFEKRNDLRESALDLLIASGDNAVIGFLTGIVCRPDLHPLDEKAARGVRRLMEQRA
ncbi:MAG: HEAT repeat domain-containing protein [Deltaproteobacteria bacterium]|nr:HEAT repeat domain-containing protein [Deltaproteobacteria bacterium]